MRRGLAALFFAPLAAAGVLCTPSIAAAADPPTITVSLQAATVGQLVSVTGHGFPPTSAVSVQLCGNQAAHGSTDCDVVAGQTVVTDQTGAFQSQVVARFPPVPCPCVIWASSSGASAADATAPLSVVSAAVMVATPTSPSLPAGQTQQAEPPRPALEVVASSMRQPHRWRSWLGLPDDAELVVVLRNNSTAALAAPLLTVTAGKSADPSRVVPAPTLDLLQPGAEQTVVVPVHLGALSFGRYTVRGTVGGAQPITFRARLLVLPWLPAVVLATAVFGAAVALRRRRRRHGDVAVDAQPKTVDAQPEPVGVDGQPEPVPVDEAEEATTARAVRVTFSWPAWVRARSVSVAGEFNDWSTERHPLTRTDSGMWEVTMDLEPGRAYRYKFFVDGERWEPDWLADDTVQNEFGTEDSVVVVGDEDRYANLAEQTIPRPHAGNGSGNGHADTIGDDGELVDLSSLDALAAPSEDFWAEESSSLRVRLRRWRR